MVGNDKEGGVRIKNEPYNLLKCQLRLGLPPVSGNYEVFIQPFSATCNEKKGSRILDWWGISGRRAKVKELQVLVSTFLARGVQI